MDGNSMYKQKETNVEKVKLVGSTAYSVGKQQDIALCPRYLGRRIFKPGSWTAHFRFH